MATVYLRSTDGNDADDGSTWALADATLAASVTAAGAGGTSYVSQVHAETQASAMTITLAGTVASPQNIICANDGAQPPTAVATSGTVSTTGSSNITISGGSGYFYGLTFTAGNTTATASMIFSGGGFKVVFEQCTLACGGSNVNGLMRFGESGGADQRLRLELINSNISMANSSGISLRGCQFRWNGGSFTGTAPTTLVIPTNNGAYAIDAVIRGVDLSVCSGNLVNIGQSNRMDITFDSCKIHASATLTTGSWGGRYGRVRMLNCDSGDTNYRDALSTYDGTIVTETTIVKSSTLSTDGTTPISWKMVSSANTAFSHPLRSSELRRFVIFCPTTGSKTLTVNIVTDGVTLTDAECWLEVEYPGTSGYPQAAFANDRAADILATPANQTTDSGSTWTTTGLSSPVKQKLAATFTVTKPGYIQFWVALAKPSTTVYVDAACESVLS